MPTGNEATIKNHGVTSAQLKFGVDRILAKAPPPDPSPPHTTNDTNPSMASNPPCSECVSSMYHCCGRATFFPTQFFPVACAVLHAPKPIRPFSNLVIEREDRVGLGKRKRSWSRAVFSNLQRKGLERRFQMQQYITKPDRRQLAATLGLTDAQVKVWFQNRRMKWRHTREMKCHNNNTVSPYVHPETNQKIQQSKMEGSSVTQLPSNVSFTPNGL